MTALWRCHAPAPRLKVVNGRVRVCDVALTMLELPALVARHNARPCRPVLQSSFVSNGHRYLPTHPCHLFRLFPGALAPQPPC